MPAFHQDTPIEADAPGSREALIVEIRKLLERERLESALALFDRLHPADQGVVLVDLSDETQQDIISNIPSDGTAEILKHIGAAEAVHVAELISPDVLAGILDAAHPAVAADVLHGLPEKQTQETLQSMAASDGVVPLLEYADDTAGGLMNPDFLAVNRSLTASLSLDAIRLYAEKVDVTGYVAVVDDDGRPVGNVTVLALALARPNAILGELASENVATVSVNADQERCARVMQKYNLNELPVVDDNGVLRGIILADHVMGVLEQEAEEDMYRIVGVGSEAMFGPLVGAMRSRLPWLYVNLGTAFLAAFVIGLFEQAIVKVVALAVFLPVVLSQGGMGGIQTLTLTVRSMALGGLTGGRDLRLILREVLLGAIQGLSLGIFVGLVAYLWKGDYALGVILGAAMVCTMVVAGLVGAGVPLLLRRMGMDPAVSAAVFVTTFTDVVGILLFLGLATVLMGWLT